MSCGSATAALFSLQLAAQSPAPDPCKQERAAFNSAVASGPHPGISWLATLI